MKKLTALLLIVLLCTSVLTGCSNKNGNDNSGNKDEENSGKKIDVLTVAFIPSRDPDSIITATEPLKNLLKEELKKADYNVGRVDITVGTSYEAVGEALSSGTVDVGLIPGSTYILYDDGADVILTATRNGLNNDSEDPKEWNENKPTTTTDKQVTYYRSLIIAGPSAKGMELADKVNSGQKLTWEDLNSANWAIMSSTSPAGYVYPTLWLKDNYDKTLTDLSNAVTSDSYGSAFARLAAGQIDIVLCYADARIDNEEKWNKEFGRTAYIWDETNVIGVTAGIYNDTVCVSKTSEKMDEGLQAAIQDAFINIGKTDEGKQVISIYNHNGYLEATSGDYDKERDAQKIIRDLGTKNQ